MFCKIMGNCKVGSCVIFSLACLTLCFQVHADPPPSLDLHVVEIDVCDFFLFKLIQNLNFHFSDDNLRTVFRQILVRHHISFKKVDVIFSIRTLESKLRRLWKAWTCKSSGHHHTKLSKKWEKSKYALKVSHKTGSPTKRKLEEEVKDERVKHRKLESDLDKVNEELVTCNKEKM